MYICMHVALVCASLVCASLVCASSIWMRPNLTIRMSAEVKEMAQVPQTQLHYIFTYVEQWCMHTVYTRRVTCIHRIHMHTHVCRNTCMSRMSPTHVCHVYLSHTHVSDHMYAYTHQYPIPHMHMCMFKIPYGCEGNWMRACRTPMLTYRTATYLDVIKMHRIHTIRTYLTYTPYVHASHTYLTYIPNVHTVHTHLLRALLHTSMHPHTSHPYMHASIHITSLYHTPTA